MMMMMMIIIIIIIITIIKQTNNKIFLRRNESNTPTTLRQVNFRITFLGIIKTMLGLSFCLPVIKKGEKQKLFAAI